MYAECGGLMYLGREIVDFDGASREMAGLIPVRSSMSNSRLSLGYREVEALSDGPVLDKGQRVRGHEFHWSSLEEPLPERSAAYRVLSQNGRLEGFRHGSIWASYIHVHLGSGASLAPRFVESAARSHARLASR
jgi:cobyrinic acid a,c-diamide synthase